MNDRAVSLFEKYDILDAKVKKGRGMLITQKDHQPVALQEYNGPLDHLEMEYELLLSLRELYDGPIQQIYKTNQDEYFCTDYEGKKYVLKSYAEGRECNLKDAQEVLRACKAIAMLHKSLRKTAFLQKEELLKTADPLRGDLIRHTTELKRARNFMRKKARREEFELAFLRAYDTFFEQTEKALELIEETEEEFLNKKLVSEGMMIHGDCVHHNILMVGDQITFVHFEKSGVRLQVRDLYLFMRKAMEKNCWSYDLALRMLDAYEQELSLCEEEKHYLCARFCYPEKFWKLANSYLNRVKSLPSRRLLEKLEDLEEKEAKRRQFLHKWLEKCG